MKSLLSALVVLLFTASSAWAFGSRCSPAPIPLKPRHQKDNVQQVAPPSNFKVVFLGDQGLNTGSRAVLQMIRDRKAELVIHSGDFDYSSNPTAWINQIDSILGPSFPYFASIGNHDNLRWSAYQKILIDRIAQTNASCTGDIGVQAVCNYKGLLILLSGVGTRAGSEDHDSYITNQLSRQQNIWKIVSWHKNHRQYQIGGKLTEVGIEMYEAVLKQGAILATGHEHSYCRSHLMSSFEDFTVADTNNTLNIEPGKSFVFVSGLGGESIRDWNENLRTQPYWAATAASNNGVQDGALFCTFNIENNPRLASCEFVDQTGKVWDTFRIYSKHDGASTTSETAPRKLRKSQLYEVAVMPTDDDFSLADGSLSPIQGSQLLLGEGFSTFLRFRSFSLSIEMLPLIESVHLQLYGASAGPQPSFVIRALVNDKQMTDAAISWDYEEDNFVNEALWNSPDVLPLLKEVANRRDVNVISDVTFVITGKGVRKVWASEHDTCLAPTLLSIYKNRKHM